MAGALLFLAKTLAAVNHRLSALEAGKAGTGAVPARGSAPATVAHAAAIHSGTPVDTIAAIVAAVHVTLGSNHRILKIGAANHDRQAWSMEGRRQVFHSHKVR